VKVYNYTLIGMLVVCFAGYWCYSRSTREKEQHHPLVNKVELLNLTKVETVVVFHATIQQVLLVKYSQ